MATKKKPVESTELAAEWVPLSKLKPWGRNPRPLKQEHVRELMRSIRRFGFGSPIMARRENFEIIAGHGRYAAALSLKLERVPVRFLDLTEVEAHAMSLADNKIQENRSWDRSDLSIVLDELSNQGVDLTLGMGFGDKELDKFLSSSDAVVMLGNDDTAPKMNDGLRYRIVVDCSDEYEQSKLIERFEAEGLKVKPLMS
jgi:hypothetical protein